MARRQQYTIAVVALFILITLGITALNSAPTPTPEPHPIGVLATSSDPLVAFLAPAQTPPHNIYILAPAAPDTPEQLTFSASGIYDFAASPAGRRLAFSEYNASGGTDLKLLEMATGAITLLADCGADECRAPAWHPAGDLVAYERMPAAADGPRLPRVWLVNPDDPADARPLMTGENETSAAPCWSPDGRLLAVYDALNSGILLHELADGETAFIPSQHGSVGSFSPDGQRMVYADMVFTAEESFYSALRIVDLAEQTIRPLAGLGESIDDEQAIWIADGQELIVSRRYLDNRYTSGRQLYRVSAATGDAKPLVVDTAYYSGSFTLDPSGQYLLLQRLPQPQDPAGPPPRPEIWLVDMASGSLSKLYSGAFLPRWVP